MNLSRAALVSGLVLLFSGCQLPTEISPLFRPDPELWRMRSVVRLAPMASEVKVHTTTDLPAEVGAHLRRGYLQVGRVHFYATEEIPTSWLTAQAKATGADVVLARNEYLGEERTMDSVPFSGLSVPVMRPRFRFTAVFLRKVDRLVFGVHVRDLSSDDRYNFQRTTGAKIVAVMENTSAATAGLQPDDILITAGEYHLESVETLFEAEAALAGQDVPLQLLRDGTRVTTTVHFENL